MNESTKLGLVSERLYDAAAELLEGMKTDGLRALKSSSNLGTYTKQVASTLKDATKDGLKGLIQSKETETALGEFLDELSELAKDHLTRLSDGAVGADVKLKPVDMAVARAALERMSADLMNHFTHNGSDWVLSGDKAAEVAREMSELLGLKDTQQFFNKKTGELKGVATTNLIKKEFIQFHMSAIVNAAMDSKELRDLNPLKKAYYHGQRLSTIGMAKAVHTKDMMAAKGKYGAAVVGATGALAKDRLVAASTFAKDATVAGVTRAAKATALRARDVLEAVKAASQLEYYNYYKPAARFIKELILTTLTTVLGAIKLVVAIPMSIMEAIVNAEKLPPRNLEGAKALFPHTSKLLESVKKLFTDRWAGMKNEVEIIREEAGKAEKDIAERLETISTNLDKAENLSKEKLATSMTKARDKRNASMTAATGKHSTSMEAAKQTRTTATTSVADAYSEAEGKANLTHKTSVADRKTAKGKERVSNTFERTVRDAARGPRDLAGIDAAKAQRERQTERDAARKKQVAKTKSKGMNLGAHRLGSY